MEIDSQALTICEVTEDGGTIVLGFTDTSGDPASVRLPLSQVGTLALVLPDLISRALRTRFGDHTLRYAYPLTSWTVDRSGDRHDHAWHRGRIQRVLFDAPRAARRTCRSPADRASDRNHDTGELSEQDGLNASVPPAKRHPRG